MKLVSIGLALFTTAFFATASFSETEGEVRYLTEKYDIPMLGNHLIYPGSFEGTSLEGSYNSVKAQWARYFLTFTRDPNSQRSMLAFMRNQKPLFREILREETSLTKSQIEDLAGDEANLDFFLKEPTFRNINEFEQKAVWKRLGDLYEKSRYHPQAKSVPVVFIQSKILGKYDFTNKELRITGRNRENFLGVKNWTNSAMALGTPISKIIERIKMSEDQAQVLVKAAEASAFGPRVVFLGVEVNHPLRRERQVKNVRPNRIVLSLSPDLTDPFFEFDVEAELEKRSQAQKAAVEAQREAAQSALDGGFNRARNSERFETAGLKIGQRVPSDLNVKEYLSPKYQLPALKSFFHAELPNGQVAFYTDNGRLDGNVIFFARAFQLESLTPEKLVNAAVKKFGSPASKHSSRKLFWWDATVPKDRHEFCHVKANNLGLGNATLYPNGGWSRPPLYVDVNAFRSDCGIVVNLSAGRKLSKIVVADTTWFNKELIAALEQQENKNAEQSSDEEENLDL